MKKYPKENYQESILTYVLSWILNIIFAIFVSWNEIIHFLVLVGNYGWNVYAYLLRIVIVLVLLILLNILLLIIFRFLKITYKKLNYWFGTLFFALLPYAWLILCCIDTYIRYGRLI